MTGQPGRSGGKREGAGRKNLVKTTIRIDDMFRPHCDGDYLPLDLWTVEQMTRKEITLAVWGLDEENKRVKITQLVLRR